MYVKYNDKIYIINMLSDKVGLTIINNIYGYYFNIHGEDGEEIYLKI